MVNCPLRMKTVVTGQLHKWDDTNRLPERKVSLGCPCVLGCTQLRSCPALCGRVVYLDFGGLRLYNMYFCCLITGR